MRRANDEKLAQLLRQKRDKHSSVRIRALESLADIDHPMVVSELIESLSDPSSTMRWTAAQYLGDSGKKEAIKPLVRKLSDHNSEVRMRAAESLGVLLRGSNSPPTLIKKLRDPNELVRIEVAQALGSIGDRKALPRLWKAIDDHSPLVRSYIAAAIGILGGKRDIPKLWDKLRRERSDVSKLGFYDSLYHLGERKVFQDLLSLMESKDYKVRSATAKTLADIANRSNAASIVRTLRKSLKLEPAAATKGAIQRNLREIIRRFPR